MTAPAVREMLSVEAARDAILAEAVPVGTERVLTATSLGRVVAEAVTARISLPPWVNSAMDGYAVRAADTDAAGEAQPVQLRVIGDIRAGVAPGVTVQSGTVARIATGARLPEGADAVVPVELTTPLDAAGRPGPRGRDATGPLPSACLVHQSVPVGGSVRETGSDLSAGATLLPPGSAISPAAVALLAGAGVSEVLVHRRPRVGVLATGDEIRRPGEPATAVIRSDFARPGDRVRRRSDRSRNRDRRPLRRPEAAAWRDRGRSGCPHRVGGRFGRTLTGKTMMGRVICEGQTHAQSRQTGSRFIGRTQQLFYRTVGSESGLGLPQTVSPGDKLRTSSCTTVVRLAGRRGRISRL